MKSKTGKTNQLVIIGTIVLLVVGSVFWVKTYLKSSSGVSYTSKDLKLSFQYPNGWILDEKNREILIANYKTSLNQNNQPEIDQVAIIFDNASLCQPTLDEEVLKGGCGEGVNSRNTILSKTAKEYPGGSFIVYAIRYPTEQEDTFYYFQNADKILQISKQPDPSLFEKEFESIINSIRFL